MNSSGERISAGWSFVGGTLLGALTVVGLTGSIHAAGAKAGGSGSQTTTTAVSEVRSIPDASVPASRDASAPQTEREVPRPSRTRPPARLSVCQPVSAGIPP
jgi:hypothetical protein